MNRIDGAAVAVALPVPAATNAPGYFSEGNPGIGVPATVVTGDWLNAIQEELINVIVGVGGLSPDKALTTQLKTSLYGARAIRSGTPAATMSGSTQGDRALVAVSSCTIPAAAQYCAAIAAQNCTVEGTENAVIASSDSSAKGGAFGYDAAVLASQYGKAWGDQSLVAATLGGKVTGGSSAILATGLAGGPEHLVTGNESLIAASGDTTAIAPITIASQRSAIIASDRGAMADVAGVDCALVATQLCTVGGGGNNPIASGAVASRSCSVKGQNCGAFASFAADVDAVSGAAALACSDSKPQGVRSLVAAARTSITSDEGAVVIASRNVENHTQFSLCGGYDAGAAIAKTNANQNQSWRLQSNGGDLYIDGSNNAGAADYAEVFENLTPGAIEPGMLIALTGRKARIAQYGDRILGVVSARPAMVGNSPMNWQGKHTRDQWGRAQIVEVPHVRWPELQIAQPQPDDPEAPPVPPLVRAGFDGAAIDAPLPLPADADVYALHTREIASDFDTSRDYVSRTARPIDWTIVGLLGQLPIRVLSDVEAGDDLVAGPGGLGARWDASVAAARIGRRSEGGARIEVMEIASPWDNDRGYAIALCMVR